MPTESAGIALTEYRIKNLTQGSTVQDLPHQRVLVILG